MSGEKERRRWRPEKVVTYAALISMLGVALVAMGFRFTSPAVALQDHTTAFDKHVEAFDSFAAEQAAKETDHVLQGEMVTAQTKLMCLRTGTDTLVMLGVIQTCDSLGVGR